MANSLFFVRWGPRAYKCDGAASSTNQRNNYFDEVSLLSRSYITMLSGENACVKVLQHNFLLFAIVSESLVGHALDILFLTLAISKGPKHESLPRPRVFYLSDPQSRRCWYCIRCPGAYRGPPVSRLISIICISNLHAAPRTSSWFELQSVAPS